MKENIRSARSVLVKKTDVTKTIQHRLLFPAHPDDGPGNRPEARRVRAHTWRRAPVYEPPGAGGPATGKRTPGAAADENQSRR